MTVYPPQRTIPSPFAFCSAQRRIRFCFTGRRFHLLWVMGVLLSLSLGGCAVPPKTKTLAIKDTPTHLMENTILRTDTASAVSREQLYADLAETRVVYVGEQHTNPSHHAIQVEIIQALMQTTQDLTIGMEMFDHTYQSVLDEWVAGKLEEPRLLQRTHWYANWRFDYGLYRCILDYANEKGIRIIALIVPSYIPARIGVGGIASLSTDDRRHLPEIIDTNDADHRAYI
jgi:uncharacterized iron-regulated protein